MAMETGNANSGDAAARERDNNPEHQEQQQQQQQQPNQGQDQQPSQSQTQIPQDEAPATGEQQPQTRSQTEDTPQTQQSQHQPSPPSDALPDSDQQRPPPPASPPLPKNHHPATPGPRAARFIQTYNLALHRTLSRVDYANFASCFPTVAAHAPNALRNVQKQMVDYLEERCHKDFSQVLDDRDVVRKLNDLEALVADADARRSEHPEDAPEPIPPHTLPPEAVVHAHLHPHLAQQHSQLSAALANSKLQNETLFADVKSQRDEIEALLATIDAAVADVDSANALLGAVADDLAAEARTADIGIEAAGAATTASSRS